MKSILVTYDVSVRGSEVWEPGEAASRLEFIDDDVAGLLQKLVRTPVSQMSDYEYTFGTNSTGLSTIWKRFATDTTLTILSNQLLLEVIPDESTNRREARRSYQADESVWILS